MHPRTLLMLVIGFVGGLALAACGPANSCTSATCGGCCDAMGKCQSGATSENCGISGASCGRCGTGTMCQSGECRAGTTGGGGGAATGGGGGGAATGGGAGGGTGCRQITMLDTTQANLGLAEYRVFMNSPGHYNYAAWIYPPPTAPETLRLEVVYPNDAFPTFPYTEFFSAATRYRNCIACAVFYDECNPTTFDCNKHYLAQSGSITITRADRAALASCDSRAR